MVSQRIQLSPGVEARKQVSGPSTRALGLLAGFAVGMLSCLELAELPEWLWSA